METDGPADGETLVSADVTSQALLPANENSKKRSLNDLAKSFDRNQSQKAYKLMKTICDKQTTNQTNQPGAPEH